MSGEITLQDEQNAQLPALSWIKAVLSNLKSSFASAYPALDFA
jgi:hypothetical protein